MAVVQTKRAVGAGFRILILDFRFSQNIVTGYRSSTISTLPCNLQRHVCCGEQHKQLL